MTCTTYGFDGSRFKTFVFYYVPAPREGLQLIGPNWAAPVTGTTYAFDELRPWLLPLMGSMGCACDWYNLWVRWAAPMTGTTYWFDGSRFKTFVFYYFQLPEKVYSSLFQAGLRQ